MWSPGRVLVYCYNKPKMLFRHVLWVLTKCLKMINKRSCVLFIQALVYCSLKAKSAQSTTFTQMAWVADERLVWSPCECSPREGGLGLLLVKKALKLGSITKRCFFFFFS
jgi:hypothetical protein